MTKKFKYSSQVKRQIYRLYHIVENDFAMTVRTKWKLDLIDKDIDKGLCEEIIFFYMTGVKISMALPQTEKNTENPTSIFIFSM